MSLSEGLRLAVGTFTRIPSGQVSITPGTARSALCLAPVAVAPLALGVAAVGASVELGLPPLVAAGLALALLAYGTRAMHLDGLADTVDGLGAGWDRERALEVMRRGDLGPMGAVAIVLVLLLQATAIAALLSEGWRGALLVGAAVIASRVAGALVCARGQQPSPGSRLGAAFVGTVPFAVILLLSLLASAVLVGLSLGAVDGPGLAVVALAAPAAMAATVLLRGRAARTFGGVGGDVIGAGIEVALTVILVVLTVGW